MGPTEVCNMSLGRFGANRINNYDDATETKPESIQCRLHYEQTRNALQRAHMWRYNKARASLSRDTNTPAFEFAYQYHLPNDFLRLRWFYEDNNRADKRTLYSYSLEGKLLLTDETAVNIVYSKLVIDPNEWDPLFVEVMVLTLALKLIIPVSQSVKLKQDINNDLVPLMRKVRALDREEGDTIGRYARKPWLIARHVG